MRADYRRHPEAKPKDLLLRALIWGLPLLMGATQQPADGPVLRARHLARGSGMKVWVPAGRVRFVAWDRDSVVVRGTYPKGKEDFFFGGDSLGVKFGIDTKYGGNSPRTSLVAYVPRWVKVSVKTVSASIDARDVSGWFYSVSGPIHLAGGATSFEVESMNGTVDVDATVPYVKARTGDGHLVIRGSVEDVDASTIGGALDIAATSIRRGQFSTVSGDIRFGGALSSDGIFDFSSHSGNVDIALPENAAATLTLSSIEGRIENGFARVQPTATGPRSMRLALGRDGPRMAVRTFRGAIRLRPR
jgi:hypothetical protein